MQVRLFFAVAIYLASYLPLSVILLMQDLQYEKQGAPVCYDLWTAACALPLTHGLPALVAVTVCSAGLGFTLFTLRAVQPKQPITIVTAKHVPADLMNYVLPYVVSFMGLGYGEPDKVVGFLVFFAWIFLITYRSGQIIMNPVLTVFGWRLYELEFQYPGGAGHTHAGVALSRQPLAAGETLRHSAVQDVLIVKKATDAQGA